MARRGSIGIPSPAGPSPLAAAAASERYLRIAKLNVSADGGHTYVPDIRPPSTVPVYEQSPMPGMCSFRAENLSPDTTASTAPVSVRSSAGAQEPPTFRWVAVPVQTPGRASVTLHVPAHSSQAPARSLQVSAAAGAARQHRTIPDRRRAVLLAWRGAVPVDEAERAGSVAPRWRWTKERASL
jgi:hypothetical protein